MARLALVLVVLLAAALTAMLWQHFRYLHVRRTFVQDHQAMLHGSDAFHVVTFLELAPGSDPIGAVRKLRDQLASGDGSRMVYAGKVAVDALASSQLVAAFGENVAWDAIVVVQHPSREAWERAAASGAHRDALAGFARTYSHGMERSAWLNLALPQLLLARRIQQIVTRAPSHYPFVPGRENRLPEGPIERMEAARELGRDAAVVVNLTAAGDPQQRAADAAYTGAMLGLMAEGGHGPMHLGRSVTLEGDARFDQVAIVYYPGIPYFVDMARSTFYQGIVGDKQLGDTQASITVPILDQLEDRPR